MAKEKDVKTRVNIVMSDELIEKIDKYAEEMCISRSSAISVLCSLQFKYEDNLKTAKELMSVMNNPDLLAMMKEQV